MHRRQNILVCVCMVGVAIFMITTMNDKMLAGTLPQRTLV